MLPEPVRADDVRDVSRARLRPARDRKLDGFLCGHCGRIQHPSHLVGAGGVVAQCKLDCIVSGGAAAVPSRRGVALDPQVAG
jgi:hypothetical protein